MQENPLNNQVRKSRQALPSLASLLKEGCDSVNFLLREGFGGDIIMVKPPVSVCFKKESGLVRLSISISIPEKKVLSTVDIDPDDLIRMIGNYSALQSSKFRSSNKPHGYPVDVHTTMDRADLKLFFIPFAPITIVGPRYGYNFSIILTKEHVERLKKLLIG